LQKFILDRGELSRIGARLGDAVIDPAVWPEIMEQIGMAVGATGAVLLQSDARGPDAPRTAGVEEMINNYFTKGWYARDVRADRGIPLLMAGQKVVIDQDILTPEDMDRSDYYAHAVSPFGFRWFAAVGFSAESALWALVIQRTREEGSFDRDAADALGALVPQLTQAATLSRAVGKVALSSVTRALDLVKQPAIALDRLGLVIEANSSAHTIFDDDFYIKKRRLKLSDGQGQKAFDDLCDRLRAITDREALTFAPIVVRRRDKRPLIIRTTAIDGAARTPFLGARALLVVSDPGCIAEAKSELLARALSLSPSEGRLASLLATGRSLEQAADQLGISYQTARNHLKAVFAKTGTHRQGELVILLSRF
jgi:DNA-binding CsgD family transcriptional regulator